MPPLRRHVLLASLAALLILAGRGLTAQAYPADPPARLYRVILAAPDARARTELTTAGVAIDAIGQGTITTLVDAEGLDALRARGQQPLAVTPLDFPPTDAAYHTYAEMVAALQQRAAAYPAITRVITAGFSLEGRAILAVKISDAPDVDAPTKPAALFMALHHAREHLTVEMALEVIRLFTEGYGVDPALTNLVNTREIWVLPNANPDGGEYDVATGVYQYWRKNRRANPDGSIGVDLNRNYGYRWGGPGASPWPGDETYRGPAAFSEPETQVVRDFVRAHPNIMAAISFHTYAELILYPYGYTDQPLPPDMDPDDYRAFVALAQRMAATNGYTPQQSNALYTTSGDTVDWLYGERGIFGFTFEMYPRSYAPGFYPPGAVITRETQRNDAAVAYLTAMSDHPRKVIGLDGDTVAPEVSLAVATPALWRAGTPITLTATVTDAVGVTLVAWQAGGEILALDRDAPFTATWTTLAPGPHVIQAWAFDAGGNQALSAPITATALTSANADLILPDPPIVSLTEPLVITFTHPISPETLVLRFDPPLAHDGYWVESADGLTAQVFHAPFQPATRYELTLESGHGPDSTLTPTQWRFWSAPWRVYLASLLAWR